MVWQSTGKAVHTQGGVHWVHKVRPLQESCYLRGVQGLAPTLTKASRLLSEASQSKVWCGSSKARWAGRGKSRCPTYPSRGGGGGKHTFGVRVRVGVTELVEPVLVLQPSLVSRVGVTGLVSKQQARAK